MHSSFWGPFEAFPVIPIVNEEMFARVLPCYNAEDEFIARAEEPEDDEFSANFSCLSLQESYSSFEGSSSASDVNKEGSQSDVSPWRWIH